MPPKDDELHDLSDLRVFAQLDEAIAAASRVFRARHKSQAAKALALGQGKTEAEAIDAARVVYEREMKRPLMYVVSSGDDEG